MKKEILNQLTKLDYFSFVAFLSGYIFALTSTETTKHLVVILSELSTLTFTISYIILFLFAYLLVKSMFKLSKSLRVNSSMKNSIKAFTWLKVVLLGYFLGAFTLLGNAFIEVLFKSIL